MAARTYTRPELRERLKRKILRSSKGGRPGQWSARKAQLLASEYKTAGGGYRGGKKAPQKYLDAWTREKWTTSDGQRARRGAKTTRYLPKSAWSKLSAAQKRSTNRKKVAGSRRGKQFVRNTKAARVARKKASRSKRR